MRTHTQNYKNQIKEYGREFDYKITYFDEIITGEHLSSVTPVVNTEILKSVMKELDFESDLLLPLYTAINVEIGLKIDKNYEYINYGQYIIYNAELQEDKKTYKYICYDNMLFSMKDYEKLQNGTFPMSLKDYITRVCADVGLTFVSSGFANENRIIQTDLYKDLGYTYRDILDECSEAIGGNLIINQLGQVEVKYPTETNDIIDESYLKDVNVDFGEKYGPINTIVLSRSAESDNIERDDPQSVAENGRCEIKIIDNQIMNNNDRVDYLADLLLKLNGLSYYVNDFTSTGITYYEPLDIYTVKIADKYYRCLMLNDEQHFTTGLVENIYTDLPTKTETDYTKSDKTDRKINQTNLIVDKQQQRIIALIKKTDELTQKDVEIEANLDGVSVSVTELETQTNEQINNLDSKIDTTNQTMTNYVNGVRDDLQNQIDGNITTYFYPYTPTLNNIPASEWTTNDEKNNHIGDLFYDTTIDSTTGESKDYCYRFMLDGTTYRWELLSDTDITKALQNAQKAQDTADNKRRVFVVQPTVPYDVGDLWFNNEKLFTCMTAKTFNQTFSTEDWEEKTDYTNDDKANEALKNQVLINEATGTHIHLEDSSSKKTEQVKLDGRSTQETTEIMPSPEFPSEIESISGEITVDVVGKNMANPNFAQELLDRLGISSSDSNTCITTDEGRNVFKYAAWTGNGTGLNYFFKDIFKENMQYTFNCYLKNTNTNDNKCNIALVYTDGTKVSFSSSSTNEYVFFSYTSLPNKTISEIKINWNSDSTFIDLDTVMLYAGTTEEPYEPYQHNQYLIDLQDNELCSLPNGVKDELVIEEGSAKIVKKISKRILDGTESYSLWSDNVFYLTETLTTIPNAMSDYFTFVETRTANALKDGQFCLTSDSNNNKFLFKTIKCSTVAEFKQWLVTNNTKLQFELETPYEIDLGEVTQPRTSNPISNISNSEVTNMYVKYYTNSTFNDVVVNKSEFKVASDAITSLVSKSENLSREAKGYNSLYLDKFADIGTLKIKGQISLLYTNKGNETGIIPLIEPLYPSSNLFSKNMNLLATYEDKTESIRLPFGFLNYINDKICDEFIYENGECYVLRRVGVNANRKKYELTEYVKEPIENFKISIPQGNVTLSMQCFEDVSFEVVYIPINEYTSTFATQAELNSSIKQMAGAINLSASKKVGKEELINEINISTEAIKLKGNRTIIESDNLTVTSDGTLNAKNGTFEGTITSNDGKIGGWTIGETQLLCEIKPPYDYTSADVERIQQIVLGNITPTPEDYAKYDFDGNGIDIKDMGICNKLVMYNLKNSNPGKLLLDTSDWFRPIKIINSSGEILAAFGVNGVYAKSLEEE